MNGLDMLQSVITAICEQLKQPINIPDEDLTTLLEIIGGGVSVIEQAAIRELIRRHPDEDFFPASAGKIESR